MDYQMKYDHQWLCTIVSVSLVVVRRKGWLYSVFFTSAEFFRN